MNAKKAVLGAIIFVFGSLAGILVSNIAIAEPVIEYEESVLTPDIYGLTDVPSPKDRISEDQIHVYDNRILIDLENAEWATFADTNSMDPVIDNGANAIEIVASEPGEIQVGDIVSYSSNYVEGYVIHRVVETGYDEDGWYALFKGDNSTDIDPEKVRFDQIERIVVAIIY